MAIDTLQLEKLLSEKKFDEASILLKNYLELPLEKEERGEALTLLATLYMTTMNSIEEEYSEMLQATLTDLDEVTKAEHNIEDKIALKKVRQSLM